MENFIELSNYYSIQSSVYDKVYQKPERQNDLKYISIYLCDHFYNKEVLEIASGTGYWTKKIAQKANKVMSLDICPEMISIAKKNNDNCKNIEYLTTDIFNINVQINNFFNAAFSGFWWSHIPHSKIAHFIDTLHLLLQPMSQVIFIDNIYVPGISHKVEFTDKDDNTYVLRYLKNGKKCLVLKNYHHKDDLINILSDRAKCVEYTALEYTWILRVSLV